MTSIPAPPVPLSQVGRAAHDIGLAGLLGGNLFGRLALHPSVTRISDMKRRLNVLGLVSLAAEVGLASVNSALNQQSFRRPPRRRALPWRRP